jgi:hypothetical protein
VRRQVTAALIALGATLARPAPARADQYFVFPEIGFGVGRLVLDDSSRAVAHTSLHLGAEWDQSGVVALGWLIHLAYFDTNEGGAPYPWKRVSLAPMFTASLGYGEYKPFLRFGLGPQVALSWRARSWNADVGGGAAAEVSVGFKDLVEGYLHLDVAGDRHGASFIASGGVRVNIIFFAWIASIVGGFPAASLPHHGSSGAAPAEHGARPVPEHPAQPDPP